MKGLYEILTEKKWMVSPDFVHGIRKAFEQNLNAHIAFGKPERNSGYVSLVDSDGSICYPEEYQISEDGLAVKGTYALNKENEQDFPFVSVLTIDGPITRNGGGCSYGSVHHRDMMIQAANHPLCRGHIFIIDTPGGSAWAKNDYQQAIEYARSLGQPVIAFVDGMCASAGMYLASLCDERYFMHPKDQVGCIGVMAAFYTQADGSKNQFTDETYHELYDPESFDKNRSFRDIANEGDTEELVKELADLGVEFRADVKKSCPNATDEHLHGKVFDAENVVGVLMDGQSTFFDCVQRCFALYSETTENEEQEVPDTLPEEKPEVEIPADDDPDENNSNQNINMANYPLINAACGLKEGEIEVREEGAFMNAPLLDALEANLNVGEQKVADAEQRATMAEQSLADMQGKYDDISAQLTAVQEAKEVAEKALAEANEELANVKDALATAEQNLADKDAQIAALNEDAGDAPDAGNAPENNGEGAEVKTLREFDPSLYKTNAERKAAFERFKRGEA